MPDPHDYRHPTTGRIYREGDPAHHFAQLARHDRDYLGQYQTWLSDPDRLRRIIQNTADGIDKAYTRVTVDWHAPMIDPSDPQARAEQHRKYGPVEGGSDA